MAVRKQQPAAPRPKATPKAAQKPPSIEEELAAETQRLNQDFGVWLEKEGGEPGVYVISPLGMPLDIRLFVPKEMEVGVFIRPKTAAE